MARNVQFYGSMNKALGGDPIQRDYAQDPRRLMAQQLMQQGSSTAPVQSPLEGLTRALSGVAGGYFGGQAQRDMQEREQALSSDISTAMEAATPRVVPATPATYSQSGIGDFEPSTPETTTKGGFAGIVDALRPMDNPDLDPFRQRALMGEMQQRQTAEQAAMQRTQKMEDFRKQLEIKQELGITDGSEPSSMREWNRFQKMTPTEQSQYLAMKRASPWLNTGESFVKPDPLNRNAPPQIISIKPKETETPVFKAAVKKAENQETRALNLQKMFPKARGALQTLESKSGLVADTIDKALGYIDAGFATGIASNLSYVPWETDAAKLKNDLMTIKANIGFDRLQEMRDNSVTGGALGAINKSEMDLLQAVNGALDPTQGSQLVENLKKIKRIYPALLAKTRLAYETDFNSILNPASTNSLPPPPPGFN